MFWEIEKPLAFLVCCVAIVACLDILYFEMLLPLQCAEHRMVRCLQMMNRSRVWKGAAVSCFNLLKPTGHVMHQQFNIQQLYVLPTLYYVFCIYLRTNSDMCHLQHKLIGFYNRDEKCLLRGTNWVFK